MQKKQKCRTGKQMGPLYAGAMGRVGAARRCYVQRREEGAGTCNPSMHTASAISGEFEKV